MTIFDFNVQTIKGSDFDWDSVRGKKIMIVNVASACGLTPQYAQLQELYETYKNDNFTVIGFPSNDFAGQEPGTNDEIATFCETNYGVNFPMMAKITVVGEDMHPLYRYLTEESHEDVTWNFQKYLINEHGEVVEMIPPRELPISPEIIQWIKIN